MLKIKDNVDLKELEKFGFEYQKNKYQENNKYIYKIPVNILMQSLPYKIVLSVNIFTRELKISANWKAYDLLYDLIEKGLVEKVSDK